MKVAWQTEVERGKVGAVLFTDSGYIVAAACNRRVNGVKKVYTIHAEEMLLAKAFRVKALERLGRLNLIVVRVKRSEPFGIYMAKPCARCRELLARTNVRVFYSDRNGKIRRLRTKRIV